MKAPETGCDVLEIALRICTISSAMHTSLTVTFNIPKHLGDT